MNPYAVLMMARTLEQDRERSAAERRPIHRPETTPRRESWDSWAAILRFPRFTLQDQTADRPPRRAILRA
jgi:hypothetical protein